MYKGRNTKRGQKKVSEKKLSSFQKLSIVLILFLLFDIGSTRIHFIASFIRNEKRYSPPRYQKCDQTISRLHR